MSRQSHAQGVVPLLRDELAAYKTGVEVSRWLSLSSLAAGSVQLPSNPCAFLGREPRSQQALPVTSVPQEDKKHATSFLQHRVLTVLEIGSAW